ncbi:MAG: N-acetylglucosamine-6-phosphate deacetylase, partial [Candidatus Neomarinimicrobiota bacterium]
MSHTICLRNGTVFTGISMAPQTSVVIRDGKVADVVSNSKLNSLHLPKDTTTIYVNGAYIAPGFIDTHIHGIHGYDTSDGTP